MQNEMDLETLKREQPALVNAFLHDHSEERTTEIVNSILRDLEENEESGYRVKRLNGHYDVRKITEDEETRKKGSERSDHGASGELERKIRVRAKVTAGLY